MATPKSGTRLVQAIISANDSGYHCALHYHRGAWDYLHAIENSNRFNHYGWRDTGTPMAGFARMDAHLQAQQNAAKKGRLNHFYLAPEF